jgi:ribokinase
VDELEQPHAPERRTLDDCVAPTQPTGDLGATKANTRTFVLANHMNADFLCVERLSREGESLAARRHVRQHGGKCLDLAVGLHRPGVTVDLPMAVGANKAGGAVTCRLAEEGLCTKPILTLGVEPDSGVGLIG